MSTMVLPALAVLAGALCLLFFALFTRFYFRNRREALELRDRLAAEADRASGAAPVAPVAAHGASEGAPIGEDRVEGV